MPLSYNEFRSAHKGVAQSEISTLWKMYKDGDYKVPEAEVEEPVIEEPVIEEPVVEVAPPAPPAPPAQPEKSKLDLCNDFNRAMNRMQTMTLTPEVEKEVLSRLRAIAADTIPEKYECAPSDSWKIWFGPTQECLLINTTQQMAFKVDRKWWSRNYQTTVLVDRELLNDTRLIEAESLRYARMKRYVPRYPLVGVECKLPQSYHDIQMRGGQGDR